MENLGFIDRVSAMMTSVMSQDHGSLLMVFVLGIIFGGIIQFSRFDKFEKIAGFSMLKDTTVPKMLFLMIGISSVGLYFMVDAGLANYHVKPILLGGLLIGGILFGTSMAIMGKCPGTGPISIAEGRIDILVGVIGGVFGGLLFTVYYDDFFAPIIGSSIGKFQVTSFFEGYEDMGVLIFGAIFIIIAIVIPKKELLIEESCSIEPKVIKEN